MNLTTFSALAEENRFTIVELLKKEPYTVNELVKRLHIRQPQVSKHLKVLSDAGIVAVHPQANKRIYTLAPQKFKEIDQWIQSYQKLWNERYDRLEEFLNEEKTMTKMRGGDK